MKTTLILVVLAALLIGCAENPLEPSTNSDGAFGRLSARVDYSRHVQLTWNDHLDWTSYDVLRDGQMIARVKKTRGYTDTTVVPGCWYEYSVRETRFTNGSETNPVRVYVRDYPR